MTVEQYFSQKLQENGLWPDESTKVLQIVKGKIEQDVKWNSDKSHYPTPLYATLWYIIKEEVIDYLKATKPKHFALCILQNS